MLYEIHITVDTKYALIATEIAKDFKWKTSEIARDPILGNKNFFYLTKYAETEHQAHQFIYDVLAEFERLSVLPIRTKIEHIIYDKRYV